ncbi:hypothetical protein PPACK8108_LOCUS25119, partial [Phakopsora pachyrhizi]
MRVKLLSSKIILSLATFSRAAFFNLKTSLSYVKDSEPSFLQSGDQRLQPWNSQVESYKSPTINLFPGKSDCIPLANQQQRGEKRIREDTIIESVANGPELRLDLRLGISQPDIVEVDNKLPERKRLRKTSLILEQGLKIPEFISPSLNKDRTQRLQPWSSQVGTSVSPTVNLFPRESDSTPLANQQEYGLKPSAIAEAENQISERKKLRLSSIFTLEHGKKHSDVIFESAHNEPGSHIDLHSDILRPEITKVYNQLSEEKRHCSTSLTLDHKLKLPGISSTSSIKDQKADKHHIYAMHDNFIKGYEKDHLEKVKSSFVTPDKELRKESQLTSPATGENSMVDGRLQEISNTAKIDLSNDFGDKSSNLGNKNQGVVFENWKKVSNNISASNKSSTTSEVDDKLKNQWINTGGSSSKNAPTENSLVLSLLTPPEENFSRAMSLARSLFQEHSQLGSIDFKIFLKNMIDKKNSKTIKKLEIDLDFWGIVLSQASRSHKIIVTKMNKRKLYNREIKNDDFLYVKGKEVVPLSESMKNHQFEKLYLQASAPNSSVNLTLLKQYVYDDHKFNQILALQSLDNYVESFFKRLRNKAFCTDIVLGSIAGLVPSSEKDTEMIKGHKVKAWSQYETRFRLKVLPQYYGCELSLLMLVTEEMGFKMGIRRLKDLKIYTEIKRLGRELKKMPHLQSEPAKKWIHLANKITTAALYKIILLYQIFTPFDSEAIENLKLNQLACSQKLYTAWKEIIQMENPATVIIDHQAELSNINPFLNDAFINQFSSIIKADNYEKFLACGSNYILNFWLKHYYTNIFEFLSSNAQSKTHQGFFTFLSDCTISDFIETYP